MIALVQNISIQNFFWKTKILRDHFASVQVAGKLMYLGGSPHTAQPGSGSAIVVQNMCTAQKLVHKKVLLQEQSKTIERDSNRNELKDLGHFAMQLTHIILTENKRNLGTAKTTKPDGRSQLLNA